VTRIGVEAAQGRARLTLTGGALAPRVIRVDESGARIGLVATEALLLGGDHIDIEIDVGPGAWLELVETAGTVAYDAGHVQSSWTVRIRIGDGGVLVWVGEPFVISQGANVRRQTTIDLTERAVACLRETLVLGRTGEIGGAIRSRMSVRHAGRQLLAEDLDLTDPEVRQLPGLIGTTRVIDTVSLLGMRPPAIPELPAGRRFDLDGPGSLARSLGTTLSASPIGPVLTAWRNAALRQAVSAATTP
jgi:urease accessory protein